VLDRITAVESQLQAHTAHTRSIDDKLDRLHHMLEQVLSNQAPACQARPDVERR